MNINLSVLTDDELDAIMKIITTEYQRREENTLHEDWNEVVKALDNFFAKGYDYITINDGEEELEITPNDDYKTYDGAIMIE